MKAQPVDAHDADFDARSHTARDLEGYRDRTEEHATEAERANDRSAETRTRILDLKVLNPEFAHASAGNVASHFVFLILLVGVFWIDFLLFGAVAEYFAMSVFGEQVWLIRLAKILVPAAIATVEVAVGWQVNAARLNQSTAPGQYRLWLIVAIVLTLVMPCAAVATALASSGLGGDPSTVWLTVALAILAFVCHTLLIFGDLGHKSQSFFFYRKRRKTLEADLQRWLLEARNHTREAIRYFRRYRDCILIHNRHYPADPLSHQPFNAVTHRLLSREVGPTYARDFRDGDVPSVTVGGEEGAPGQNGENPSRGRIVRVTEVSARE